jgi:hypothetical protein
MAHRIEILDNNAVNIFNDDQETPVYHQPGWPDGREWASPEEATVWAENFVITIEHGIPFKPNGPF